MKRFTVSIPDELKKKLDSHPEINWPEYAKQVLLKKLEKYEELERRGEL